MTIGHLLSSQYTLSTRPNNTSYQPTLSTPIITTHRTLGACYLLSADPHTLSIPSFNIPYQPLNNIPYQHLLNILTTHLINTLLTSSQHPLSITTHRTLGACYLLSADPHTLSIPSINTPYQHPLNIILTTHLINTL